MVDGNEEEKETLERGLEERGGVRSDTKDTFGASRMFRRDN